MKAGSSRRSLCLLGYFALSVVCAAFAPGDASLPLALWRFKAGDDMNWAAPDFDDGQWQEVTPPAIKRFPWIRPRGWFRCTFVMAPDDRASDLGVWLGRIESADEVYLNGHKIGGTGTIADAFTEAPRKLRIYRLPKVLLDDENTLAVRVQNSYPSGGLAGRPELGAFVSILAKQRAAESKQMLIEAFLIGLMVALALLWIILRLQGLRRSEARYLLQTALLLAVVFLFESTLFHAIGLNSPALFRFYILICVILPVPVLGLIEDIAGVGWLHRSARWTRLALLALAALYLLFGDLRVCSTLHAVWGLLVVWTLVLFVAVWRCSGDRSNGQIGIVGLGLTILGVGALADFILGLLGSPYSRSPMHWACALSAAIIILDHTTCFARLQLTLQALSQRLLSSREDEAKRISRDLHDGLGQSLAATKLHLQCILQRQPASNRELCESLNALIQESSRNVDLLHRTVQNLRPASLNELGLAAALREIGDGGATGMALAFHYEIEDIRCLEDLEDCFYRIAQEAVGNALKHSKAKTIWIRFRHGDGKLRLEVEDDGVGFNVRGYQRTGHGLGLVTMHERLAPFGGMLVVRSEPGAGTTVIAEVYQQ